mgnify:CR=1 FL=1
MLQPEGGIGLKFVKMHGLGNDFGFFGGEDARRVEEKRSRGAGAKNSAKSTSAFAPTVWC